MLPAQRVQRALVVIGLLLCAACEGSTPSPAAPAPDASTAIAATAHTAPSAAASSAVPSVAPALQPFPVEAFGGRLRATMDAVAAPTLETKTTDTGDTIVELEASIGVKHPVSCTLRTGMVLAADFVRGLQKLVGKYDWSVEKVSVRVEASRIVLRARYPFRDTQTHELLGAESIVLALGSTGSIFCYQPDAELAPIFERVADSLVRSAGDFSAKSAQYAELWAADAGSDPTEAWSRFLVPRDDGGSDESVAFLHAEEKAGKMWLREVRFEIETDAHGEVRQGASISRDEDAEDVDFGLIRQGPTAYVLGGSARGQKAGGPVRTAGPLVSFLSLGSELRKLATTPKAVPLSWSEFGGFASAESVNVFRDRVAHASGEHEILVSSKDEEELCHVSDQGRDPCDRIELRRKGAPSVVLKRLYVAPAG